jgi:hypothetical protein
VLRLVLASQSKEIIEPKKLRKLITLPVLVNGSTKLKLPHENGGVPFNP